MPAAYVNVSTDMAMLGQDGERISRRHFLTLLRNVAVYAGAATLGINNETLLPPAEAAPSQHYDEATRVHAQFNALVGIPQRPDKNTPVHDTFAVGVLQYAYAYLKKEGGRSEQQIIQTLSEMYNYFYGLIRTKSYPRPPVDIRKAAAAINVFTQLKSGRSASHIWAQFKYWGDLKNFGNPVALAIFTHIVVFSPPLGKHFGMAWGASTGPGINGMSNTLLFALDRLNWKWMGTALVNYENFKKTLGVDGRGPTEELLYTVMAMASVVNNIDSQEIQQIFYAVDPVLDSLPIPEAFRKKMQERNMDLIIKGILIYAASILPGPNRGEQAVNIFHELLPHLSPWPGKLFETAFLTVMVAALDNPDRAMLGDPAEPKQQEKTDAVVHGSTLTIRT